MSTRNEIKARVPESVRNGFAYERARFAAVPAALALERARAEAAAGRIRYGRDPKSIAYAHNFEREGESRSRWVENASDGLRRVGFADEIARAEHSRAIQHQGWFSDSDDTDSIMRGVVFQLPTPRGRGSDRERYVYGYAEASRWSPNSDSALLVFDPVSDKLEAARLADRVAELAAEREREYREAWAAGSQFAELGTTRRELANHIRALLRELREACERLADCPHIRASLRQSIRAALAERDNARKERAELKATFGREPAFQEGSEL
jgi:hypothetical protein